MILRQAPGLDATDARDHFAAAVHVVAAPGAAAALQPFERFVVGQRFHVAGHVSMKMARRAQKGGIPGRPVVGCAMWITARPCRFPRGSASPNSYGENCPWAEFC